MGLFGKNPHKMKQIELQNIIFGTADEKKLMVSPEFLDNMSKAYVSKRMKKVNKMVETLAMTKSPRRFFKAYDSIMTNLEELISIEKLYTFKKPVPSEFKKKVEEKKDHYIECMIKRVWKSINQKSGINPGDKKDPQIFGPVLAEMLEYRERYNDVMLDLIDSFYKSVYEQSFRIQIEDDKTVHVPKTAEEDMEDDIEESEDMEEIEETDMDPDDGFTPEDFIQMTE